MSQWEIAGLLSRRGMQQKMWCCSVDRIFLLVQAASHARAKITIRKLQKQHIVFLAKANKELRPKFEYIYFKVTHILFENIKCCLNLTDHDRQSTIAMENPPDSWDHLECCHSCHMYEENATATVTKNKRSSCLLAKLEIFYPIFEEKNQLWQSFN